MQGSRPRLIREAAFKWLNGTTITYGFYKRPARWKTDESQKDLVRHAFALWKSLGIGLEFAEVAYARDADVRIAFDQSDGSWSYVGTDVLKQPRGEPTMNFGWSLTEDPVEGLDTALHEIGHALGFPHEHQNPIAGIEWNEAAVYRSLAAAPNRWSRATTFHNIIEKIAPDTVAGSSWDPNSVMHLSLRRRADPAAGPLPARARAQGRAFGAGPQVGAAPSIRRSRRRRRGSVQRGAAKIPSPPRNVQRTFAKLAASAAGSASSTTMSASMPAARRPRFSPSFQRAAGVVVSDARICMGPQARLRQEHVLLRGIVVGHVADVGPEEDFAPCRGKRPHVLDGGRHEPLRDVRGNLLLAHLVAHQLQGRDHGHAGIDHLATQRIGPGRLHSQRGVRQDVHAGRDRLPHALDVGGVGKDHPAAAMALVRRRAGDVRGHSLDDTAALRSGDEELGGIRPGVDIAEDRIDARCRRAGCRNFASSSGGKCAI